MIKWLRWEKDSLMKLLNIKDLPCVQYRRDKKAHLSCKCKFHGNSLQQQRIFYYSGSFGNYRSLGKNKTKIISIKCNNLWYIGIPGTWHTFDPLQAGWKKDSGHADGPQSVWRQDQTLGGKRHWLRHGGHR